MSGEQHPVFRSDPIRMKEHVGKAVEITMIDQRKVTGWLYTVDPVSESYVLMTKTAGKTSVDIILGHAVKSVDVLDDSDVGMTEEDAAALFGPKISVLDDAACQLRKNKVKDWLLKNRLPVVEGGGNGELLCITDALVIYPPYETDTCASGNEIILGKVIKLLQEIPDS